MSDEHGGHITQNPRTNVTANRINIKTTAISSIVIREMNSISVEILSHDAMLERYTLWVKNKTLYSYP